MLKQRIFLTSVILSIASITLFAQDSYINSEIRDIVDHLNWNKSIHGDADIEGSPYLDEEFQSGDVYYNGKYKFPNIPLRYNLYSDEMEYKDRNVIMALVEPDKVDKITIGKQTFIYLGDDEKKGVSGFVKMWNDSFPTIITKMKIDYLKKEPAKPYVDPKPDRYERDHDKHYLMKSENEIVKISSIKKLIKSLDNHLSELSDFAKKEKISANDPDELAKLLEFYNGLD